MSDPMTTNYFGGPRHAPRAEVAAPGEDPGGNNPVGRISITRTNVNGTGNLLSNARSKKPGPPRGLAGIDTGLPDEGLLGDVSDIVSRYQEGLSRPPAEKSWGEEASDADGPTQAVETNDDGATHFRSSPSAGMDAASSVGTARSGYSSGSLPVSMSTLGEGF